MNKENTCEIVKDLLPAYQDDLLSAASKDFVEQHLFCCPDCQNILTKMEPLGFMEETDDSAKFVDYLAHIRKYQRKLLISNVIISFILGMALSFVIIPQNILLTTFSDGTIPSSFLEQSNWSWVMINSAEGYIALLQNNWLDIGIKMVTSGFVISTFYLTIYQLFIRKHRDVGDIYSAHVLCGSIILLLSGIFTFILHLPYLILIGLVVVVLYCVLLRLRK